MKNIWRKLRENWLDFWEDDELDMDKKHLSQHDKRSLNELEDAGLILRVRQGFGEPNKIYVLIPRKEDSRL